MRDLPGSSSTAQLKAPEHGLNWRPPVAGKLCVFVNVERSEHSQRVIQLGQAGSGFLCLCRVTLRAVLYVRESVPQFDNFPPGR